MKPLLLLVFVSIVLLGTTKLSGSFRSPAQEEVADLSYSSASLSTPREITPSHTSQFFEYELFIEKESNKVEHKKREADTLLGGIAPHHIPATIPLLAKFYRELKNTREVKTFIILAPDHIDKGKGLITVSRADFITPFGTLHADDSIIDSLERVKMAVQDETPFDKEHSIDAQLLFISKFFPEANVVPLLFRSHGGNELAKAFGQRLAEYITPDTFLVASVDFSQDRKSVV